MKFILPFTLLAAAVVTAQDENCEANHIVETCFASENKKALLLHSPLETLAPQS